MHVHRANLSARAVYIASKTGLRGRQNKEPDEWTRKDANKLMLCLALVLLVAWIAGAVP